MAFLGFENMTVTDAVKQVQAFTVPAGVLTSVALQAQTQNVRYTMDGSTNPTVSVGMLLLTGQPPESFTVEDFQKIRFIRDGGANADLVVHYNGRV